MEQECSTHGLLFVGWLVGAVDVPLNGYVTLSKLMKHPGSVSGPVRGRRLSIPGRVVTRANVTVGERLTVLATLVLTPVPIQEHLRPLLTCICTWEHSVARSGASVSLTTLPR